MKRLLVGISSERTKPQVTGVTINVPDDYDYKADMPDKTGEFPMLREYVYLHAKNEPCSYRAEYDKYSPEITSVISITELGRADSTESTPFGAAKIMGGE